MSTLIKELPLNSSLTICNTYYHLQDNPDGTSIQRKNLFFFFFFLNNQRKNLSCTGGGLGCNTKDYIMKGNSSKYKDKESRKEYRNYGTPPCFKDLKTFYEHCLLSQTQGSVISTFSTSFYNSLSPISTNLTVGP